jgi:hypothetical protein
MLNALCGWEGTMTERSKGDSDRVISNSAPATEQKIAVLSNLEVALATLDRLALPIVSAHLSMAIERLRKEIP